MRTLRAAMAVLLVAGTLASGCAHSHLKTQPPITETHPAELSELEWLLIPIVAAILGALIGAALNAQAPTEARPD